MEAQKNVVTRILVFLLVGLFFVVGMIAYSSARSSKGGRLVDKFDEYFDERGEWTYKGSDETERRLEKTFDVRNGGKLTIEADNGSVDITTWEKSQVAVVVDMSGDARVLKRYRVDFDSTDSTVSVVARQRKKGFFPWHWQSSDVHFQVKVPSSFHATVNTAGGDVEISGLGGNVHCETSGGDLRLTALQGSVYGETSGGDVIVRNVRGSLEAHTSGGNIEVDSVTGPVKVGTSGGEVVLLDVDGKIFGETSGGNIEARLLGDNRGVHLETSGGNITVYVPRGFAGDLDASTSGGSVECDLPVTVIGKVRDHEVRGKMNGGGSPIELSTSGGNIYVRSRQGSSL